MVVVEAYRAINHFEECKAFILGHRKVLQVFDIANITSANLEWAFSPSSVIITIKRKADGKLIGGARLQIADDLLELPIESAVGEMDDEIFKYINNLKSSGIAEVCGMWNTREAAKLGIGSQFLTRSAICVAPQLNLKSLIMLCAPSTVSMAKNFGAQVIKCIGNEGKFYYPKLDLVATAMLNKDIYDFSLVESKEVPLIKELVERPILEKDNVSRRGLVSKVFYDLRIK